MNILFTSSLITPFIQEDLDFLQEQFKTRYLRTKGVRSLLLLPLELARSSLSFTWFASVYAGVVVFLGRVFGCRSIVVVGGVDVAHFPEVGYGIWVSPWKKYFARYTLRNASKVLVVDPSLAEEAKQRAIYNGRNVEYIPTGYDHERWKPSGDKQKSVLTVASCLSTERLKAKGVDFLIEVAADLPEIEFTLIGVRGDLVRESLPTNLRVMEHVSQNELLEYYQRAKVYCQPSMVEGLPNALCEAMLCECIPVATNVGGTMRAVGSCGFLVEYRDRGAMKRALLEALGSSSIIGVTARQHVIQRFPLVKRHQSLLRVIHEVLH